jgi:hypothetical protein
MIPLAPLLQGLHHINPHNHAAPRECVHRYMQRCLRARWRMMAHQNFTMFDSSLQVFWGRLANAQPEVVAIKVSPEKQAVARACHQRSASASANPSPSPPSLSSAYRQTTRGHNIRSLVAPSAATHGNVLGATAPHRRCHRITVASRVHKQPWQPQETLQRFCPSHAVASVNPHGAH